MATLWSGALGRRVAAAWVLAVCVLTGVARGQSTEGEIKARLVGKELYLRGFWIANKLSFDAQGTLAKPSLETSFTLSGMKVEKVSLGKDKLKLNGLRKGLIMDEKGAHPSSLYAGEIEISVDTPVGGDFGPALDKIFVEGLEAVKPLLPTYWQPLAKRNFVPFDTQKGQPPPLIEIPRVVIKKPGGHVQAPKVIGHHPTTFLGTDRYYDAPGMNNVAVVLGADGKILEYHLWAAAGLGRDEEALVRIKSYVWQPAIEDGIPVAVEIDIETDYEGPK